MSHLAIRGAAPVRSEPFPAWPEITERDVKAVADVVRNGQIGGWPEPGPRAAEFAERFAAYQGAEHGIVMSNGTVTMEVALKALGIGWGDEVIVPALTFAATAYAAVAAGALPVVVDIEPERWTIDPAAVEAAITPRTRAVMPVHLGQQMCDMDALTAIADRHGLAIVEDCAHAHGQRWNDRGAGSIGAFGSFSHQSSKVLTAGEGGTLLTNDPALARRAHSIIDCGRPKDADEREYTFGCNYRLGELNCALLCTQLDRYEEQRAERERGARLFEELAAGLTGVRLNTIDPRITRWGFYRYLFAIDPDEFAGAGNEAVVAALEAEGIPAELQYPPMSRYDLFQPKLSRLPVCVEHAEALDPSRWSFPVAEEAGERRAVYLNENVFRAGREGVEHVVEAIAKVQRHADELRALTAA
jgi:dTDP-4-amino-4,6-dideoxygalactose transaminase